ncbi:glutaredoxin [Limosilactobacillus antri DSM 16041]|uniref:Glutaredoxin-like protein NrdH n=4 Tax=Limosilactobacillus TaxID=2742598 RepID=C8P6P1_9LACO|nr:glutaredoxin [Limosilactobacillus antri DSM 16041]
MPLTTYGAFLIDFFKIPAILNNINNELISWEVFIMVTVFSKNNCIQCKMTKKFLQQHQINFVEHNIDEQPEYVDQLKAAGFLATPVVKLPNGSAFSGFRPDRLQALA